MLFGLFLLQTTIAIIDCFPIVSMQIEVTTRLNTCYYYRFEGGEFSDPLKSFMLLLAACLAGLDEFSGGKV